MAVQQFNNEGFFSPSGVWTTGANWSTGSIPVDDDRVLVRNTGNDINTVSGQSLIDLERLHFDPTCRHKVGGSGDRLTIDVNGAVSGDGPGYLTYAGTGSHAWFTVDTVRFIAQHLGTTSGSCVVKHRSAGITEVVCESGLTQLDGGTYTTIVVSGSDTRCVIDSGSSVNIIVVIDGVVECSTTDTIATLWVFGGEFHQLADEAITAARIWGGSLFLDGEATTGTLTQFGGVADLSRNAKNKVITTYEGHAGTLNLGGPGVPSFGSIYTSDALDVIGADKLRI